jgi:hypothetical protein
MFDTTTRAELDRLHADLHQAHAKIHDRLTGDARIPYGLDWDQAHATACALTAAMTSIGVLLRRELASTDAWSAGSDYSIANIDVDGI